MKDQNSQQGSEAGHSSKENRQEGQGGYMATLHSLEEKFYGPDSPLDAKGRVILYLRHRALRDWTTKKRIPKDEIIKATGLLKRNVERALVSLERQKHILVIRTKIGKVWQDNIYELHPARYGTDYIYRPEKPSFKVIYGSKGHKSNKTEDAKSYQHDSSSYQQSETLPSETTVDVPSKKTVGVPSPTPVGNALNHIESLDNSRSKNPLKEPFKKTLSEKSVSHSQKTEDGDISPKEVYEAKMLLQNLVGNMFGSIPR